MKAPVNRDLFIALAATLFLHGLLLFVALPYQEPEYEVVVAPSVIEVSLVKTPPKKVEKKPPPPKEQPVVEKIPEPEQPREVPKPEPEPEPVVEKVEEVVPDPPEEVVEEQLEPEPEEEVVEEVVEEVPEVEEMNVKQGATLEAQPLVHFNQPPRYPRSARRKGWEGRVILDVLVSKEGSVSSIRIEQTSGYDVLDREAVNAIEKWRFEPARVFGRVVEKHISIPVMFKLE